MLAVIYKDRPSLLVANIRPRVPSSIDQKLCGEHPYRQYLLDLVTDLPKPPFMVIEFDRQTLDTSDLVLCLSNRRILLSKPGGQPTPVDIGKVTGAVSMLNGVEEQVAYKIARLADERDRDITRAEEIDLKLDKAAEDLPEDVDLYDLLEALPATRSLEWRLAFGLVARTTAQA